MLHHWHIEAREYERHEQRRGRRHAYEHLEPATTALVVVDMIPFFVEHNPYAAGIVPNINAIAASLRDAGGTVAWVVPARQPATTYMIGFYGPEIADTYASSASNGPPRTRLAPNLDCHGDDLYVDKTAPSAFFPGRCDLHDELHRRGIDTVLIAGAVANVCCESTARDASTLGYRTIMIADANAAATDRDLDATLHTIYRSFGDVRTSAEIDALVRG